MSATAIQPSRQTPHATPRTSQRRAQAVQEYLATSGGLGADKLKAVSYGEARNRQVVPGARGPGDQGIENRRVALVIDHAAIATDQVAAIE